MKFTYLSIYGNQIHYYPNDIYVDLLPKLKWSRETHEYIAVRSWKCLYNGKMYTILKNLLESVSRMTKAYPYEILFNGIPVGFYKTLADAKLRCQYDAFSQ